MSEVTQKTNYKCLDCDYEAEVTYRKTMDGRRCPKCKGRISVFPMGHRIRETIKHKGSN